MRLIDVMNRRFRFVSMKLKSPPMSRAEVQKGELNFSILGKSKKFIATKGRGKKTSEEDGRFSLFICVAGIRNARCILQKLYFDGFIVRDSICTIFHG